MATDGDLRALFKSDRLLYRAPNNTDKDFYQKYILTDAHNLAMMDASMTKPGSEKAAEAFFKFAQEAILGVMICLRTYQTGDEIPTEGIPAANPIGFIILFSKLGAEGAHHRQATLGLSLGEEFRGKGYGGEAINWALDWAFNYGGLHRVAIETFSYNTNALKLYRRLGFVEEGREREALYFQRKWHDIIRLAMLEQEWEALRDD